MYFVKTNADDQRLAEWIKTWQRVDAELEKLRRGKIRNESTAQAILNLADASRAALLRHKPAPTSGLVEMQSWFKLLRRAENATGK